jgi:hypothetical protein
VYICSLYIQFSIPASATGPSVAVALRRTTVDRAAPPPPRGRHTGNLAVRHWHLDLTSVVGPGPWGTDRRCLGAPLSATSRSSRTGRGRPAYIWAWGAFLLAFFSTPHTPTLPAPSWETGDLLCGLPCPDAPAPASTGYPPAPARSTPNTCCFRYRIVP